ncbi:50S ribosomal protein L10 [Desulfobacca acetoxidans]|uniref:Large ribosomal subunit protein uL10 n=1 Tax=Desulfobacca acetoxidans (strain ATCC 700848 / DSM 11109 / ASRB2) TaxID=880072 RepID=F2NCN9_DESAR|nr:50S ribosomal protein L10 [Desulfobacca acetoxidans]AEB09320.1 50S ribosomal protein L10 [Desulfobacca acetoxidans DSM 11109]
MQKAKKSEIIEELQQKLERASFNVLADFKGMKVAEFTQLRRELKNAGGELIVAKNTLLKLAAGNTEAAALESFLVGPTAIALGYQNPVEIAKILAKYAKDKPDNFFLKAGRLNASVLAKQDIIDISKLPDREVLLAKLLGALQGVPTSLVSVLSGIIRQFLYTLQAIADKQVER